MEKFKRSFSMRKKRDTNVESSKPHQWQEDERKVREGSCSFQVKYLGCIEVFESRGIQICEEAVKALKSKKSRSVWSRLSMRKKRDGSQQSKSSHHRAILYVTGDALRVVDEISKGLIVDQTIEKVSFCAPDRNHEKGFAYICRDGTTRRWMCHGFFAVKESGERLSHAVGCAFAICLEKKQQREKEKVTVTYNENGTSFTRMGSFRQTTLTERLADPQSAILAEPVPLKKVENPFAVQRPHASVDLLERQGSFRGFTRLADTSPFKRNISLRLNELPSTLDRQRQAAAGFVGPQQSGSATGNSGFSVIMEAEEQSEAQSPVANACSQLSDRLAALSATGNASGFSTTVNGNSGVAAMTPYGATAATAGVGPAIVMAPPGFGTYPTNMGNTSATFIPAAGPTHTMPIGMATVMQPGTGYMVQPGAGGGFMTSPQPQFATMPRTTPVVTAASPFTAQQQLVNSNAANPQFSPFSPAVGSSSSPGPVVPMRISNPWAGASSGQPSPPPIIAAPVSVHTTAASSPNPGKVSQAEFWLNSTANQIDPFAGVPSIGTKQAAARSRGVVNGVPEQAGAASHQASLPTGATGGQFAAHHSSTVVMATVHHQGTVPLMNATGASMRPATSQNHAPTPQFPVAFTQDAQSHNTRPAAPAFDPFDSAWAAKSSSRPVAAAPVNNPFQQSVDKVTPAFQVQL